MKKPLKFVVVSAVIIATLFISALGIIIYWEVTSEARPYYEIRENIRRIELGMSREEVLEIMGEPVTRQETGLEVWWFDDDPLISVPARCFFDDSGRVFKVVCDDDYRLTREQSQSAHDRISDTSVVADSVALE